MHSVYEHLSASDVDVALARAKGLQETKDGEVCHSRNVCVRVYS